jgi:hypothetical protein
LVVTLAELAGLTVTGPADQAGIRQDDDAESVAAVKASRTTCVFPELFRIPVVATTGAVWTAITLDANLVVIDRGGAGDGDGRPPPPETPVPPCARAGDASAPTATTIPAKVIVLRIFLPL